MWQRAQPAARTVTLLPSAEPAAGRMNIRQGTEAQVGSLSTSGGSSAVAASAHAGCERLRRADLLMTGMTRRKLASDETCALIARQPDCRNNLRCFGFVEF